MNQDKRVIKNEIPLSNHSCLNADNTRMHTLAIETVKVNPTMNYVMVKREDKG
jgi:hypothetical protein